MYVDTHSEMKREIVHSIQWDKQAFMNSSKYLESKLLSYSFYRTTHLLAINANEEI